MFGLGDKGKPGETPAGFRKRMQAKGKGYAYNPHTGLKQIARGLRHGATDPVAATPRREGDWGGWNRQQERERTRRLAAAAAAKGKSKARGARQLEVKRRQKDRELAIASGDIKPGLALSAVYGQSPGHRVRQKTDETGKRRPSNLTRMH
jgi:hypothetical protein